MSGMHNADSYQQHFVCGAGLSEIQHGLLTPEPDVPPFQLPPPMTSLPMPSIQGATRGQQQRRRHHRRRRRRRESRPVHVKVEVVVKMPKNEVESPDEQDQDQDENQDGGDEFREEPEAHA